MELIRLQWKPFKQQTSSQFMSNYSLFLRGEKDGEREINQTNTASPSNKCYIGFVCFFAVSSYEQLKGDK